MIGGDTIWVQHPVTEATAEVPHDALAIYRQSGWEQMSEGDVAEMLAAADAERVAAEQAMSGESQAVLDADPAVPAPVDGPVVDPADAAEPSDDADPNDAAGKGRAAKTKES